MIIIEKWVVKQSCVSYQTLSTFTFSELKFLKWISTFYCKIYCKFYTGTSESDYNIDLSKTSFLIFVFITTSLWSLSHSVTFQECWTEISIWSTGVCFYHSSTSHVLYSSLRFSKLSTIIPSVLWKCASPLSSCLLLCCLYQKLNLWLPGNQIGIYQCFYLLSLLLGDFFLFILELNVYSLLNKDKSLSSMYQVILSNFLFFWELFITEKLFINLT